MRVIPFLYFLPCLLIFFVSLPAFPQNKVEILPAPVEKKFDHGKWEKLTRGLSFEKKKIEPYDKEKELKKREEAEKQAAENTKEYTAPEKSSSSFNFSLDGGIARFILFTIVIVVLVFVLIRIFGGNILARGDKAITTPLTIRESDPEEHIDESDLEKLRTRALQQKEFRLALRLYYLMLLKELSLHGFINWKKDKTNYEYIRELSGKSFQSEFRSVTLAFERSWYGNGLIGEKEYEVLSEPFGRLLRQLKERGAHEK